MSGFCIWRIEMTPTEALALIDKIENCLQRMRIDSALRVAMIEDLDRLRKFVGQKEIA